MQAAAWCAHCALNGEGSARQVGHAVAQLDMLRMQKSTLVMHCMLGSAMDKQIATFAIPGRLLVQVSTASLGSAADVQNTCCSRGRTRSHFLCAALALKPVKLCCTHRCSYYAQRCALTG